MRAVTKVITILLFLVGAPSGSVHAQAERLPLNHPYQVDLYAWLGSLRLADVEIPTAQPTWDGTYQDVEQIANLWKAVSLRNVSNPVYPGGVLHGEARWFVLNDGAGAGIEGSGVVRNARYPNNAAYWYQVSLPLANGSNGNPYYRSVGLCNRALVSVAVDMMLTDFWHDQGKNPWDSSVLASDDPRFLGGLMNSWAYTYGACKGVIPPAVRQAFEAGMERMVDKLFARGVSRHTPNMQTRTVSAMAHLYVAADNAVVRDKALKTARKFMFGHENNDINSEHLTRSLFYPAGYVQEGFSPETTYNGVSLYHLTEARAVTWHLQEWDFMDEPLRRMNAFRSHQLFIDENGATEGPSAYAGRTGGSWDRLQASHPWRDITLAAEYAEARPFATIPPGEESMVSKVRSTILGSRMQEQFGRANKEEVPAFQIDQKHHWPSYVPYFAKSGWYERLRSSYSSENASFDLPFSRKDHYFNRSFANDFWSYKSSDGTRDFGFFVESEADGGTYDAYRGGSLQAFWAEGIGITILGRKNKEEGEWAEIEEWSSHHLWGIAPSGRFSSAVETQVDVQYALGDPSGPTVRIEGSLKSGFQNAPQNLRFNTSFRALPNGLSITHTVRPESGTPVVNEVNVSLPIYLRDCNPELGRGTQCSIPDATIEYQLDGQWRLLTGGSVRTQRLRVARNFGAGSRHVIIQLDKERQVRLSPSPWQQTYQAHARTRSVHVSLLDGEQAGQAVSGAIAMELHILTPFDGAPPSPRSDSQTLHFEEGWNLVASHIDPEVGGFEALFGEHFDDVSVIRDGSGRTFIPALGIEEMREWNGGTAYEVNVSSSFEMEIVGSQISAQTAEMVLPAGWSLVPVVTSFPVTVGEFFQDEISKVVLLKDDGGEVWSPQEGMSGISMMEPGRAYQVFLSAPATVGANFDVEEDYGL